MTTERRYGRRRPLHGILLNKYVGGFPYAVRLLDISETGARVRCLLEPEPTNAEGDEAQRVALELEVPDTGDRLWLWAREIWRDGKRQALAFSGLTAGDRAMLRALLVES